MQQRPPRQRLSSNAPASGFLPRPGHEITAHWPISRYLEVLDESLGNSATVDAGETSPNFRPVGQVQSLPKGWPKRVLNTITLISPFETLEAS
jgi:hypothetical protein